jgi:hypothetical protein
MAALDFDAKTRSPARKAARWAVPLAAVACLGLFAAQALGQSGPAQVTVPSLPTTILPPPPPLPPPPLPPPPLPPPPTLPPPPLPTTTTTVSTPVATAPAPAPATPPAPVAGPAVPPAARSGSSSAGSGSSGGTTDSGSSIAGSPATAGAEAGSGSGAATGTVSQRGNPRKGGLQARPARFAPGTKKQRRGTILVFRLAKPARVLISVYGPGPSCERLATFRRRGRAGVNEIPVSGSLFGRPLPPGRYAIVVEAIRRGKRVLIGRVVVTILARDGREGGSRSLAAPDCDGSGSTTAFLASAGGDFSELAGSDLSSAGAGSGPVGAGGVAGARAGRGDGEDEPLLPGLPTLPAIPSVPIDDSFTFPSWTLPALAIIGALGALALVAFGFRHYRENAGDGWD